MRVSSSNNQLSASEMYNSDIRRASHATRTPAPKKMLGIEKQDGENRFSNKMLNTDEGLEQLSNSIVERVLATLERRMETQSCEGGSCLQGVSTAPSTEATLQATASEPGSLQLDGDVVDALTQALVPDSAGMINEEELQFAVVKFLLAKESPEAEQVFSVSVKEALDSGVEVEDAVKIGLSAAVEDAGLSIESAEQINGASFQAAQLDSDTTALFDSRGGPGDNTVATMSMDEAVAKAAEALEQMSSGIRDIESRSLTEASNVAPNAGAAMAGSSNGSSGGVGGGFLWKPSSESDGNLVVLLPSSLTGNVVGASIYSGLPATEANRVEEGRFSGDTHNGGRAHFRFSNSGGSYPDGSYVIAKLRDGSEVRFQIGDSSSRNT